MKYIKFGENDIFEVEEVTARVMNSRSCITMAFKLPYEILKEKFVENVSYSVLEERLIEEGAVIEDGTVDEYDKTDYCIPVKIIDNCNGTIDVVMGKKTALELVEEENKSLANAIEKGLSL